MKLGNYTKKEYYKKCI